MVDILLLLFAYLLGSIPNAYLFGKLFKGVDVRTFGIGNVGAMNTFVHVGFLPGMLTLLTDVAKAALPVFLSTRYGTHPYVPMLAFGMVIVGHNYPLFLKFKGGKGLACLVGALLIIEPIDILIIYGIIGIIGLAIHDVKVASGIGVFSLPILLMVQKGQWFFFITGLAIALLISVKHAKDYQAFKNRRREKRQQANSVERL